MANAVVILGAGASVDFGVPMLRDVFKNAHARRYIERDAVLRQQLETMFWLPRGHTLDTSDQSLTIEEMLTLLQDCEREERLPKRPVTGELEDFRKRLYILIQKAVFEGKSSKPGHLNPLIEVFRKKFQRVTWASFNWDCIFEASFYYSSGPPPYSRSNPRLLIDLAGWKQGSVSQEYLKLHGSVNWWMVGGVPSYLSFGRGGALEKKWSEYETQAIADFPMILEPSAYKYKGPVYELLGPQWQAFLERLCEAHCVLVIGYSLPDLDIQARSKILTAFQVNEGSRWAVVDTSADICGRYRRVLGQVRLEPFPTSLTGFNTDLVGNLQRAFPNVDFSDLKGPGPRAAGVAS